MRPFPNAACFLQARSWTAENRAEGHGGFRVRGGEALGIRRPHPHREPAKGASLARSGSLADRFDLPSSLGSGRIDVNWRSVLRGDLL